MTAKSFERGVIADVAIVGGGVIGLAIARALAQRAVGDVVIIDKSEPGSEASWAAGGILGPQVEAVRIDDFFQLACASRDLYPAFAERLKDETGVDIELDQTGALYLGFSSDDEKEFAACYAWQRQKGLSIERLNASEARSCEPHISPRVTCALRFPRDWQVDNRKLVKALIVANETFGVRIIKSCEVKTIRREHSATHAIETSQGIISAAKVVVAAGAWTSLIDLPDAQPTRISIEPERGQM